MSTTHRTTSLPSQYVTWIRQAACLSLPVKTEYDPASAVYWLDRDGGRLLVVNLPQVIEVAAARQPLDLAVWATQAIADSAEYLTRQDLILRHLLERYLAGQTSDPREMALLQEHLALLGTATSRVAGWCRALRTCLRPLRAHRDLTGLPATALVVRSAYLASSVRRARCRSPRFPVSRRPVVSSPLSTEAQWLLACRSWRDGARKIGQCVVVNVPSYLLVARLLGRPLLGGTDVQLPELRDTPEAWAAAARRWADRVAEATECAWFSNVKAKDAADRLGWRLPDAALTLCLSVPALEEETAGTLKHGAEGRAPARLRRPASNWLRLQYGDALVFSVCRYSRAKRGPQIYYETPFPVPESFWKKHSKIYAGSRFRAGTKTFWATSALSQMAGAGVQGAADFAYWAREQDALVGVANFAEEVARDAYVRRVTERTSGARKRLGPFMAVEQDVLTAAFENRAPQPLSRGELQDIASRLPGRTYRAVRRVVFNLIRDKARLLGTAAFRISGWWPGEHLSRTIFASVRKS